MNRVSGLLRVRQRAGDVTRVLKFFDALVRAQTAFCRGRKNQRHAQTAYMCSHLGSAIPHCYVEAELRNRQIGESEFITMKGESGGVHK